MRPRRSITVVGCHAGGEVGNVVVAGVEPPPGATVFANTIPPMAVIGAATSSVHVIKTSICTCWTSLVIRVISDGAPKKPTSFAE